MRPARRWALALPDPLVAATVAAVVAGTAIRARLGASQPLWLDETFTGAIAAQPTLADVGHQILLDVNSPFYYVIAHLWALVFGLSNASLRFPALVVSAVAPLLCLVAPGLARRTRLVWCALIALWAPGFAYAQEARCYSLVFCLGLAATIAFIALIDAPSRRRAIVWAGLGCLAVLAHYHALALIGLQGLAFLAIHRARALKAWPAALLFVPLFGWLVVHSERIVAFTAAGVAWYDRMRPMGLMHVLAFATGSLIPVALLFIALGVVRLARGATAAADLVPESSRGAIVAALTALGGTAFWVALAFLRPTFTMRYLMPFEPGVLLGLVLLAESLRRVWRLSSAVLILLFAKTAFDAAVAGVPPKVYSFERASDALMAQGTRSLAFFWDNPNNAVESPEQLAIVGGFFFQRRGVDVAVAPLINARGRDPNPRLLAMAQAPHASILWLYDTRVHDTAAKVFPPTIARMPGWRCHDFGATTIGILACSRGGAGD